ncbi:MAG: hypothetical protein MMC33_004147 [Icmadophila ericetorum]|nr:hypothetical protein [Icmadophila ericetorum]
MVSTPVYLLDGGLGTTLEAPPYSITFNNSTPLWASHLLISAPETLLKVHEDFIKNGATVLLTATYQTSFVGFAATPKSVSAFEEIQGAREVDESLQKHAVDYNKDDAARFMKKAVGLAQEAFNLTGSRDRGSIALSLGAYGATMRPSQEYTGGYESHMLDVMGLQTWHTERLAVFTDDPLIWEQIDLIAFETLPVLNEIHAVRRVMAATNRAFQTRAQRKPWYISCVFPHEELRLPDGSMIAEVVEAAFRDEEEEEPVPSGIGINCTAPGKLRDLIDEFERVLAVEQKRREENLEGSKKLKPFLVLYPDGADGSVYNTTTHEWEQRDELAVEPKKPWDIKVAEVVAETKERGQWSSIIVGGCCKTTPKDIGKLRARLEDSGTKVGAAGEWIRSL